MEGDGDGDCNNGVDVDGVDGNGAVGRGSKTNLRILQSSVIEIHVIVQHCAFEAVLELGRHHLSVFATGAVDDARLPRVFLDELGDFVQRFLL